MQRAICRGIFAPAQPDFLAASVRDFLSGAYRRNRLSEIACLRKTLFIEPATQLRDTVVKYLSERPAERHFGAESLKHINEKSACRGA